MEAMAETQWEMRTTATKIGEVTGRIPIIIEPRYLGIISSDPSVLIVIMVETKGHRITTPEQQKGLYLPDKMQEDRIFKKFCKNRRFSK